MLARAFWLEVGTQLGLQLLGYSSKASRRPVWPQQHE